MSRDFNKVILMGRLARDPDVRQIQSTGQHMARFTICCGKQWKSKTTGELQSHTDFISVVAWGFTADVIEKYVKKGSQLLVEGHINTRTYEKEGEHKYITEVQANSVVLLGGNKQGAAASPQQGQQAAPNDGQTTLSGSDAFPDDFPLDFSELEGSMPNDDVEIPF